MCLCRLLANFWLSLYVHTHLGEWYHSFGSFEPASGIAAPSDRIALEESHLFGPILLMHSYERKHLVGYYCKEVKTVRFIAVCARGAFMQNGAGHYSKAGRSDSNH